MITIRHLERLFSDHNHRRLYRELIAGRPEATFALEGILARVVPIAALGILRLDELSQSASPVHRRLLNVVLTAQQADGGWGDPMTRDPERVRWDVLEEKITIEHARREYGVALDPATLAILPGETARLRAAR